MPLCQVCSDLFRDIVWRGRPDVGWSQRAPRGRTDDSKPHQPGLQSFVASADKPCYICSRVFHGLDEALQGHLSRAIRSIAPKGQPIGPGDKFHSPHATPRWTVTRLELLQSEKHTPLPVVRVDVFVSRINESLSSLREMCASTWSPEVVLHVEALGRQLHILADSTPGFGLRKWSYNLNGIIPLSLTGQEQKAEFMVSQSTSRHRSLGATRCSHLKSKVTCKIVHGKDVSRGERYITLSHMWGKSNIARLTTTNLPSWATGIPTDILSQTFLDSFEVAKRLGVHYICIDSLCIIQEGDNYDDWKNEAPMMYQVYTNSFLNVSANWGSSGLFVKRDPTDLDPPALDMRTLSETKEEILIHGILFDTSRWEREVVQSPLHTRAWVVQERLLSPRNLHFAQREVFFECWDGFRSESSPNHVPNIAGEFAFLSTKFKHVPDAKSRVLSSQTSAEYFSAWERVALEYSRCNFTFGSDRLIALSGVAKFFKALMPNETYVAGLWLSRLPLDMLWYCTGGNRHAGPNPESSTAVYRAPSFSWTSVDILVEWLAWQKLTQHGVSHPYFKRNILVTVSCIKYRTPATANMEEEVFEDLFGPLSSPVVEVKVVGRLKCLSLAIHGQEVAEQVEEWKAAGGIDRSILDYRPNESEVERLRNATLFFMPWSDSASTQHIDTEGLLLQLVDADMGRFKRVGMQIFRRVAWYKSAKTDQEEKPEDIYVVRHERDTEAALPCWWYDRALREHTIFIV